MGRRSQYGEQKLSDVTFISEARLSTYKKFTKDTEKAVELHNMTMQVGSSLMAVLALIELGLRNTVNNQITSDFGVTDWMQKPPRQLRFYEKEVRSIKVATRNAQKAEYSKLRHRDKKALDAIIYPRGIPANIKHETLSRKRQATFIINEGQLISQTTIFFWKRLFSHDYEEMLWKPSLKKVFPQKHIKRSEISSHLEVLYSARNRIAHHEPIYGENLAKAFIAVRYIRSNLGRTKNEPESQLQKFTEIQFHRLYIDFTTFERSWNLLKD
jgi:hypothetical protein